MNNDDDDDDDEDDGEDDDDDDDDMMMMTMMMTMMMMVMVVVGGSPPFAWKITWCPWAALGILAKARRLQLADASFRDNHVTIITNNIYIYNNHLQAHDQFGLASPSFFWDPNALTSQASKETKSNALTFLRDVLEKIEIS